jgi:MoxR-like ATPase
MDSTDAYEIEKATVAEIRAGRDRIATELSKVIVGQREVMMELLLCLFAGGHCLITGAPGLAKTLLVRSIAQIFHLRFQRIQFTPDLMPAESPARRSWRRSRTGSGGCSSSAARSSRT